MEQHQAATAAPIPRCVVRLLVLAGAALTWWLLLSASPAQADETQPNQTQALTTLTGTTAPALPSTSVFSGSVSRTVQTVVTPIRHLPHRATHAGDDVTARAPEPVRQATAPVRAAIEPTLGQVTAQLADSVDQTASGVDAAVVEPVLSTNVLPPGNPDQAAPFQMMAPGHAAAATHATPPRGQALATDLAPTIHPDAVGGPGSAVATSMGASSTGQRPGIEWPSLPTVPDIPLAPTGSTTTATAAAELAGLMILVPLLLRRRRLSDGDPLPVGPAYPPGCSPG